MAKDRIEPCESSIYKGQCKKDKNADHNVYCKMLKVQTKS